MGTTETRDHKGCDRVGIRNYARSLPSGCLNLDVPL